MKRVLPVLLAFLIFCTLPAYAAGGRLTATAAVSGDKVTVTVHLDNPGIVATRIFVRYDSAVLQLTDAKNGTVFPSGTFGKDYSADPYTMLWDESLRRDNNTTSGTLCTLTFDVKGGTDSGKTNVRFAVDKASTFDVDLNAVNVADCSCNVDVPVVTTKTGSTASTTATTKPTSASTTKAVITTPAATTAKTPSGTTAAAPATTAAASKPASTTAKPSAAAPKTTAASGHSSALKTPDEVASALSSAASSAAESAREKASSAAANIPSTAASAGTSGTKPGNMETIGTTVPAADETTQNILPADGTVSTVPETLTDTVITDPPAPANHRALLWLLLLIPAAAAVFVIVKKKKG